MLKSIHPSRATTDGFPQLGILNQRKLIAFRVSKVGQPPPREFGDAIIINPDCIRFIHAGQEYYPTPCKSRDLLINIVYIELDTLCYPTTDIEVDFSVTHGDPSPFLVLNTAAESKYVSIEPNCPI